MKTPPAWQEILLLNYRERLAAALSEMDIRAALVQALRDTASDVAGSGSIIDEVVRVRPLRGSRARRRDQSPPPP